MSWLRLLRSEQRGSTFLSTGHLLLLIEVISIECEIVAVLSPRLQSWLGLSGFQLLVAGGCQDLLAFLNVVLHLGINLVFLRLRVRLLTRTLILVCRKVVALNEQVILPGPHCALGVSQIRIEVRRPLLWRVAAPHTIPDLMLANSVIRLKLLPRVRAYIRLALRQRALLVLVLDREPVRGRLRGPVRLVGLNILLPLLFDQFLQALVLSFVSRDGL